MSENIHELKKEGKMLVPGVVFASPSLFEKIKQDKTLEQVKNVAILPGIVGKSIAMPDAHQGYGFCVGGVAAFDLENGIISPGGIGYDINCLTGDTRILTEFGGFVKMEGFDNIKREIEVEQNGRKLKKVLFETGLKTLNRDSKEIECKKINLFMSRESDDIYELTLNSGLKVKASPEHPFLTKRGMERLSKLGIGDGLAVNLFEGVESNETISKEIAVSTKILGYMFGDGCLYETNGRLQAAIYGTREDLEIIKKDLENIGAGSAIYSRERKHSIKTRYRTVEFESVNHELHIHSKLFKNLLRNLGMPLGNKTRQEVKIPEHIMNGSKLVKRLFLAGFFGAEMSSPKTSSKTCFYCPTINQNKIEKFSQNARDFLIDISLMLEEFGVNNVRIREMEDFKNQHGEKTRRFRLIISGEEDMLKLWRKIGFEYNKKRERLACIASLYILLKKQESERRKSLAFKIRQAKRKGWALGEAKRIFGREINERFVERHFYENAAQRINLDFISFEEFREIKLDEINNFGAVFDSIAKIEKLNGKLKVYDFNIADNHNFIANGFVVSNCGVRLLKTSLSKKDFLPKREQILSEMYKNVPSGVGHGSDLKLSDNDLKDVLENGVSWTLEKGFATDEDVLHTEDNGCIKGGDFSKVSQRARARGRAQLGTLGAGNHFLETQFVSEIFDEKVAKVFGLSLGDVVVLIHTGSRGLGHQTASDYIQKMEREFGFKNLPDRELACAPLTSQVAKDYLSAMACAANFAFANRQIITFNIRKSFKKYLPKVKIDVVYDIAHNIAKFEEFVVNGRKKILCVHRKGATRSFGIGRKELPADYREVGQPIFIPGSMGTSSYVLVGTSKAREVSFASTAHGAGRVLSRTFAKQNLSLSQVKKNLKDNDIVLKAGSDKGILEEAPQAYKDVDEVVRVSHELDLGKMVAKLKPMGVVKG